MRVILHADPPLISRKSSVDFAAIPGLSGPVRWQLGDHWPWIFRMLPEFA